MQSFLKEQNKYQAGAIVLCAALIIISVSLLPSRPHRPALAPLAKAQGNNASLVKAQDRAPLPPPNPGKSLKVPILMYHHIGDLPPNADQVRVGLTVSTTDFEQQLKWLKDNGYNSVSLNDIYLFSLGKFVMPQKPVVFTFDDGYNDALANAVPILKKYGYSGSFAIITQFVGTTLGTNTYATWADVAGAAQQGMEIVCHTQNHFDGSNPKFSADYIYQNLSGCQQDLIDHLGSAEQILVYPYGHYNAAYLEQAKKAGFVMGITVHEGDIINLDDLMEIPRVRVHRGEDLQKFEDIILGKPQHTATSN